MLELAYPVQSRNIVESKSLKLYLGSLSNTSFSGRDEVEKTVSADLERLLDAPWVEVRVLDLSHCWETVLPGTCIDGIDIGTAAGEVDPGILAVQGGYAEETLVSHLLKTSCPITLQPDWASVLVGYRGERIDRASLLRYLCSYRSHAGFGEECCGMIHRDILSRVRPEELTVACFYTRRGGIDINPVRSTRRVDLDEMRKYRLPRQ
jgi:7-cyano-7-deazaguanine reductase